MLEIQNLGKRFGATTALDDVSFGVERGEMVGIVGRSGAGKSTLLRTLNRLTDPTDGRIVYEGMDVTGLRGRQLREWRRRCAMIFQQFNLVQRLDVLNNVLVGRVARKSTLRALVKWFTPAERALAVMTLERVGVAEQILQRADTLSGGQQQRVAIARALVQEPDIVLADEPIASLDPHNARVVMETLRDINRAEGITVITNVHTLDTARDFCHRVIGMSAGRVVFDGLPQQLTPDVLTRIYGQGAIREHSAEGALPAPQPQGALLDVVSQ